MGNTITCDACNRKLEGVVWNTEFECEVESDVMVWSDHGNPGTDYCVDCVAKDEQLKTDAHVFLSVYGRCGIANAALMRSEVQN